MRMSTYRALRLSRLILRKDPIQVKESNSLKEVAHTLDFKFSVCLC